MRKHVEKLVCRLALIRPVDFIYRKVVERAASLALIGREYVSYLRIVFVLFHQSHGCQLILIRVVFPVFIIVITDYRHIVGAVSYVEMFWKSTFFICFVKFILYIRFS